MAPFFSKFGFIHRRLWERDGFYRAALLFGPAPLLGCLVAGAVWAGIQALGVNTPQPPSWAIVHPPTVPPSADNRPRTVQPDQPLPATDADGSLSGHQAGWTVTAHAMQFSPTLEATVAPSTLSTFNTFFLEGPAIDMARIISAGPKDQLYVGNGAGFLAIREAGVYGLAVRLERPVGPVANCVMRLGFASGRIVARLELALAESTSKTFDGGRFDLQPGLYRINWGFGCWHEHEMSAPARMTVLVGHPGETAPQPARPGDIVR
jgi:hypothetical protein